jgi:polyphosphate kinase
MLRPDAADRKRSPRRPPAAKDAHSRPDLSVVSGVRPPEPIPLSPGGGWSATETSASTVDLDDPQYYLNRELMALEFNRRVLAQAQDRSLPVLERVKFLSIFSSNMDEFFMKRVGGLLRQVGAGVSYRTPDGRTPAEQLEVVSRAAGPLLREAEDLYLEDLQGALRRSGIAILDYRELNQAEIEQLQTYFTRNLFPMLTPLAVDPAHPFPFISSLSLSIAVLVRDPDTDKTRFVRVKVPRVLGRWVPLVEGSRFVPLEQVISNNLGWLLRGMEVIESHPFRLIRNADTGSNQEVADDLLSVIQGELRERRLSNVVRLEVSETMPEKYRTFLLRNLEVTERDLHVARGPLALVDLMSLARLDRPDLRQVSWQPLTHPRLRLLGEDMSSPRIFDIIRERDLLVHHPYHSFATSVQRFVQAAAIDEKVLAIKQTLYRTSTDSPIVQALLRAVENNKQVAVLVELQARFDEKQNIEWANKLEDAGAHVAYGVVGLKTHTKTILVVRQEADGIRTYSHIGTGNYHPQTARLYTDLGLLTCREDLGADLMDLFNVLTGCSRHANYRKLLVAPVTMRRRFLELIRAEAELAQQGIEARIVAKMNSLEDPEICKALYEASRSGVQIDLVVRGTCRLRPGVSGVSDNIRVTSILGRFLEHARIYYFCAGGRDLYFIGSADWMQRNLNDRVEVVTPIEDPSLKEELRFALDVMLRDNCQAWDLRPDSTYVQRKPAAGEERRASQDMLMEHTRSRSRIAEA